MLKLLVHCNLDLLRIGFEDFLKQLSFNVKITYLDLNIPGILKQYMISGYDFVVILPSLLEDDYDLCSKLNLFVPELPVIYMNYLIPSGYKKYLIDNNVAIVMESPFSAEELETKMMQHLNRVSDYRHPKVYLTS